QIQARSWRVEPGDGASGSACASLQKYVVRPTANGPGGVGKVVSLLWSSNSKPSETVTPRTHNMAIAETALINHLTGLNRVSLRDNSAAIGITIVNSSHDPTGTTRNGKASFEPVGVETIFP